MPVGNATGRLPGSKPYGPVFPNIGNGQKVPLRKARKEEARCPAGRKKEGGTDRKIGADAGTDKSFFFFLAHPPRPRSKSIEDEVEERGGKSTDAPGWRVAGSATGRASEDTCPNASLSAKPAEASCAGSSSSRAAGGQDSRAAATPVVSKTNKPSHPQGQLRHPDHPGNAGPFGCANHHGLHAHGEEPHLEEKSQLPRFRRTDTINVLRGWQGQGSSV